ncbi:hypothetical protein [Rhodococcus sp. 06-462-5]
MAPEDIYSGGETRPSVRVEIAHIARHLPDPRSRRRTAQSGVTSSPRI